MNNYKIGDIVKCDVTGIAEYGVFVKLDNDYVGLIHISEISNKYVNNLQKKFLPGDILEAKIIEVDEDKKQLKLSIKDLAKKNNYKIKEKGKGFEPLKENLNSWVKEKLSELKK